jgi:hypothetical protein
MPSANAYSRVEKGLHYLAFSTPFLQRAVAELECDLFKRRLDGVESRAEVFITGLPRAGTTLLLELLYGTGEFATFTYRHMPFILAPLIWSRVARSHRKKAVSAERAHGDGVSVSFDSPEAFDEVVWLAYLKNEIVRENSIAPLSPEQVTDECATALRASVRKLLALSPAAASGAPPRRYLSKNNANMSRLEVLSQLFPTSTILIAFREPAAHVGSLDRQHRRFLAEHARDPFARQYMEWLGHYEFGRNLRPIDFGRWLGDEEPPREPDADFWMRYWIAAYTHALAHASANVRFVDFDRLLQEREAYLARLAAAASLTEPAALTRQGVALRSPTSTAVRSTMCSPTLWAEAESLHDRLRAAAI